MNFLLRLKSWQMFLLLVLPLYLSGIPYLGIILMILTVGIYIAWVYYITAAMHAVMPDNLKPPIIYFKYTCISLLVIMICIFGLNDLVADFLKNDLFVFLMLFVVCIFLNFAMCRFAGKILECAIEGEILYASDSAKAIFCFWFYPLRVWYIQPAVRSVLDKYNNSQE